jgi:hypothetical protein
MVDIYFTLKTIGLAIGLISMVAIIITAIVVVGIDYFKSS